MKVKSLSHVQLFVTPWTVAYHAPLSMGFSRQEYWSGLPFPSPEDLPFSRESSQPRNRTGVSCIAGGFFTSWATGEAPLLGGCHRIVCPILGSKELEKWQPNFPPHLELPVLTGRAAISRAASVPSSPEEDWAKGLESRKLSGKVFTWCTEIFMKACPREEHDEGFCVYSPRKNSID